MLQLKTKNVNICRISKLLVKYNIKASITDQLITLNDDVSEELINELCGNININSVQNFIKEEHLDISEETNLFKNNKTYLKKDAEFLQEDVTSQGNITNIQRHNVIYSEVKRGQVYWCDLGIPFEHEQGGMRPAIVISDKEVNLGGTVIIIPCTTKIKDYPSHHIFKFSSETMIDYSANLIDDRISCALTEKIRSVDKARLRKFIGTMNQEFMEEMQKTINDTISFKEDIKKEYSNSYIPKQIILDKESSEKSQNKAVKEQLLALVSSDKLLKILQSNFQDTVKAELILELFGFNLEQKGVQYLLKAIIISLKCNQFNLETLVEKVSKEENEKTGEIKRIIIARVKETLKFKKSPTIDFIRLVNNFLSKTGGKI